MEGLPSLERRARSNVKTKTGREGDLTGGENTVLPDYCGDGGVSVDERMNGTVEWDVGGEDGANNNWV